jgi:regulatory protein YycH of two-component signal transduction system YycFG
MGKEKIKTIFLAMLFVLSVLLTQRLWIIIPSSEIFAKEIDNAVEEEFNIYAEILSPQSYVYNFGGGYHTILFTDPNDTWSEVVRMIDDFTEKGFTYETLNMEQWQDANEYKSVKLRFSFPVPLELFYSDFGSWDIGEKLSDIDNLIMPTTDGNVIYIADKSKGIYLKLKGEHIVGDIASKIDEVEALPHTDYFKTEDILGIETDILLPINFEEGIPTAEVATEMDVSDKAQITAMAGRIFGETFDFVKKIEETDGSVFYISSYGEKVLKIQSDGLLEYTEKLEKQGQPLTVTLIESLSRSVAFVKNHGGWPAGAYLAGSEGIEKSGVKGYRFYFGYKINGYQVLTGEGVGAISVDVYGNDVAYYKRRVFREKMNIQFQEEISYDSIILPQKAIDRNLREIAAAYIVDNDLETENISRDQLLFDIIRSIDSIQILYYLDEGVDMEKLNPVWRIAIENRVYYCNVVDGEMLHSTRNE